MGFAAIARVTEDKWVTCQVHDEINFGLKPGDELKLETTICYEIRQSGKAVIIDEVAKDEIFCQHPTPAMYGFQSYISVPIIRQDGTFFGTLCAIDPKPAKVNNPETIALFKMYADLISVHLNAVEQMVFAEVNMISKQRSIAPAAVIIVNKPAIYNPSTEKVTPIWSGLDALSSINIPA